MTTPEEVFAAIVNRSVILRFLLGVQEPQPSE